MGASSENLDTIRQKRTKGQKLNTTFHITERTHVTRRLCLKDSPQMKGSELTGNKILINISQAAACSLISPLVAPLHSGPCSSLQAETRALARRRVGMCHISNQLLSWGLLSSCQSYVGFVLWQWNQRICTTVKALAVNFP